MKMIYFTPGPTQLYKTFGIHLKNAMEKDIASISHRSKFYVDEIFKKNTDNIRKLLNIPKDFEIFFVSSGTEAMERIIQNTVYKNSFHFVNGAFSKRFFQTSVELNKRAKKMDVGLGNSFEVAKTKIPKNTELVCFTQNETSTGYGFPAHDIYFVKKQNKDILVAVDIVSSAPFVDLDFRYVDAAFFSVQKGFGMPAGLGVMIISPDALKKSEILSKKNIIGSYHSFASLKSFADKYQTPETPNVLWHFILGRICQDMLDLGIETLREDTEKKARLMYDFFDNHRKYRPFIRDYLYRSKTVLCIEVDEGSDSIIEKLRKYGIVVDRGYGELKKSQIRIANFPAHTVGDVEILLRHL